MLYGCPFEKNEQKVFFRLELAWYISLEVWLIPGRVHDQQLVLL